MSLSSIGEQSNDRMSRVKKAYDFFCQAEQEPRAFRLEELKQVTGYTLGTIEAYRTKIWAKFLTKGPDGSYTCHGLLVYPKERFLDLHRQKKDPDVWYQPPGDAGSVPMPPPTRSPWIGVFRLVAQLRAVLLSYLQ